MKPNQPMFSMKGIKKGFGKGHGRIEVITDADLELHKHEIVALVGPSGSGKTTLLQIAGLLDNPDEGEVMIGDVSCMGLNDRKRTKIRRLNIGFVYQFHHLLPEFTAVENVMLPEMLRGKSKKDARQSAEIILERLGLKERFSHRPTELSGGEQQRVAIARAMVGDPAILLADEPTGNLDPNTADQVFTLFIEAVRELGHTALVVTHNQALASHMDKIVTISNGKLVEQ